MQSGIEGRFTWRFLNVNISKKMKYSARTVNKEPSVTTVIYVNIMQITKNDGTFSFLFG